MSALAAPPPFIPDNTSTPSVAAPAPVAAKPPAFIPDKPPAFIPVPPTEAIQNAIKDNKPIPNIYSYAREHGAMHEDYDTIANELVRRTRESETPAPPSVVQNVTSFLTGGKTASRPERINPLLKNAAVLASKGYTNLTDEERAQFHDLMALGSNPASGVIGTEDKSGPIAVAAQQLAKGALGTLERIVGPIGSSDPDVQEAHEQLLQENAAQYPKLAKVSGVLGGFLDPIMRPLAGKVGKLAGESSLLNAYRSGSATRVVGSLQSAGISNSAIGGGITLVDQIKSGQVNFDDLIQETAKQGALGVAFHATLGLGIEALGEHRAKVAAVKSLMKEGVNVNTATRLVDEAAGIPKPAQNAAEPVNNITQEIQKPPAFISDKDVQVATPTNEVNNAIREPEAAGQVLRGPETPEVRQGVRSVDTQGQEAPGARPVEPIQPPQETQGQVAPENGAAVANAGEPAASETQEVDILGQEVQTQSPIQIVRQQAEVRRAAQSDLGFSRDEHGNYEYPDEPKRPKSPAETARLNKLVDDLENLETKLSQSRTPEELLGTEGEGRIPDEEYKNLLEAISSRIGNIQELPAYKPPEILRMSRPLEKVFHAAISGEQPISAVVDHLEKSGESPASVLSSIDWHLKNNGEKNSLGDVSQLSPDEVGKLSELEGALKAYKLRTSQPAIHSPAKAETREVAKSEESGPSLPSERGAGTSAEQAPGKEAAPAPHEMSQKDYLDQDEGLTKSRADHGKNITAKPGNGVAENLARAKEEHRAAVESAIKEGKYVPSQVRKEFDRNATEDQKPQADEPSPARAADALESKQEKTDSGMFEPKRVDDARITEGPFSGLTGKAKSKAAQNGSISIEFTDRNGVTRTKIFKKGQWETTEKKFGPGALGASDPNSFRFQTSIAKLADKVAAQAPSNASVIERMNIANSVANKVAGTKDAVRSSLSRLRANAAAMYDAYKRPPADNNYETSTGKWSGADQRSAIDIDRFKQSALKQVPSKVDRAAIGIYMEAGGDQATLDKWAKGIRENPKTAKYAPFFDKATNLSDAHRNIAEDTELHNQATLEEAKATGILKDGVDNYLMHVWKNPDVLRRVAAEANFNSLVTKPAFTKQRTIPTYYDGIQKGLIPQDLDFASLTAVHERVFREALAARAYVKALYAGKASDGRPLAVVSPASAKELEGKAEISVKPNLKAGEDYSDYRTVDHPSLRGWTWAGESDGKPIVVQGDMMVHPEIYQKLKNNLTPSAIQQWEVNVGGLKLKPGAAALRISSEIKQAILSFSAFHQTTLGIHALEHRTSPFGMPDIDPHDPVQGKLIDSGLMVAHYDAADAFGEGVHSGGLITKIPIAGPLYHSYANYLFKDYLPRIKMAMAKNALERNQAVYKGKLTENQIYALTAKEANAAFGGLNYRLLGRNKTLQDVLRLTLMAPDFLEARGRFAGQAVRPYGHEQRAALIIGAVAMYTASRVLNAALNDDHDPRWDKPFSVHYQGRDYELRTVQGDIKNLVSDPLQFAKNRLSPLMQFAASEAAPEKAAFPGQRPKSFMDRTIEASKRLVPIPLQAFTNSGKDTTAMRVVETIGKMIGLNSHSTAMEDAEPGKLAKKKAEEVLTQAYRARDGSYDKAKADFIKNGGTAAEATQALQRAHFVKDEHQDLFEKKPEVIVAAIEKMTPDARKEVIFRDGAYSRNFIQQAYERVKNATGITAAEKNQLKARLDKLKP